MFARNKFSWPSFAEEVRRSLTLLQVLQSRSLCEPLLVGEFLGVESLARLEGCLLRLLVFGVGSDGRVYFTVECLHVVGSDSVLDESGELSLVDVIIFLHQRAHVVCHVLSEDVPDTSTMLFE